MAYVRRTDGVARINFGLGSMSRSSIALSPDDGTVAQNNVPRIATDRIPVLNASPRLYHTFSGEVFMGYAETKPTGCTTWCTGSGGRLPAFEAAFPEFSKVTIGTSTDGEDLFAYRLVKTGWGGNARATKHFVVCNMVHGDESDGLNGSFKAMEILARHNDFAAFRAEWTLLFIPFLNPDGWSAGAAPDGPTRNLTDVGPNGKTINLNRQADWFWNEYVESGYESKGSAPWSSSEATALKGEFDAVVAAGGTFGVFLDMHATEGGPGGRYVTRDRLMQHATETRGQSAEIPASYLTTNLDYFVWQHSRAYGIRRVGEQGGPDLFTQLIRSRFSPKIHSYFSSQGAFSLVAEEAKVNSAPAGTVDYDSACNFRLDFILACAHCCTAENWEFEDAVLVEKGTTNLLNNASWEQWQDDGSVGLASQYEDTYSAENNDWIFKNITLDTVNGRCQTTGSAGYANLLVSPASNEERSQCYARKSASNSINDFWIAARATFDGSSDITDGYKLRYDDAATTWYLERVVGSAATTIDSYVAGATTQLTNTYKTIYLRVRYSNPVELYAVVSGVAIFDTADSNAARINDRGQCGWGGQSNVADVYVSTYDLYSVEKEERPGWYTNTRSLVSRTTVHEGEKFYEDMGEGLQIESRVNIELSQAAEFCGGALCLADGEDSGIGIVTSFDSFYIIPPVEYDAAEIYVAGQLIHPTPVGAAVFGFGDSPIVHVVGGGTSNFTGAGDDYSIVTCDVDSPAQLLGGAVSGFANLMHMGFCDNSLSFADLAVDPATWRGYMFGGMDDLGSYQTSIWIYQSDGSAGASGDSMPTALIGQAAAYCVEDDCCYTFGGMAAGGPVTDIYQYDCAGDALTDLTLTVALPKALAYAAAAYCPGDRMIYIFGGEESSGDMSSTVYMFDPDQQTIEEITVTQNTSDDEAQDEGGGAGDWVEKIGRWHACTRMNAYDDYGLIILVGGRKDDNAGDLVETIYVFDPQDRSINLFPSSDYGYVRYSTKYSLAFSDVVTRDFDGESAVGAGWSDPGGNWTIGANVATSSATGGPLICETAGGYVNERVTVDARKNGAGAIVSFGIVLRGTYSGAALQDGYRLEYTEADTTWRLYRFVGGVGTVLFTYDASASPSRQLNTTAKTVHFRALVRDPVEFYAYVISLGTTYTLFSISTSFDYGAARVTDVGLVALEGQSDADDVELDNFIFQSGAINEERFVGSMMVKAEAANVSGYYRFSLMPSSYIDGIWTTRYCSQYYLVPPSTQYLWTRGRCDLRNGLGHYREDGIRAFYRTYKDSQKNYYDGPHLAKGTLIPSSFHPEGLTREDETFTFSDVLNPNCFRLELWFMPTFAFSDLDDDMELLRISIDASNYISLTAIAETGNARWRRRVYEDAVDGPHDPVLRLIKVRGGSTVATIDMICYFGVATMGSNDPVNEACDDALHLTISHLADAHFELQLDRWGSVGRKIDNGDLTAFSAQSASIIYCGNGYYSEPLLFDVEQAPTGRRVPARRRGLLDRMRTTRRSAFLAGDRDPTNGVVAHQAYYEMGGLTFGYYDEFTRGDSSSLGSANWNEDGTNYRWSIVSNQARVTGGAGFALSNYPPKHADVKISASVALVGNNSVVGLCGRFACRIDSSTGKPIYTGSRWGYEAKLVQTAADAAELRLYRYHRTDAVLLNSAALSAYTEGETLELILDMDGTSITATVTGRATFTETDDIHRRARGFGLYGSATGANTATVDNVKIEANFDTVGE